MPSPTAGVEAAGGQISRAPFATVYGRACASNERHAAVEDDGLSGHVAVAEHHRDGLRDFVGLPHAAERMLRARSVRPRIMSVSISEGATALTVMPSLTRRAASPRVKPLVPAFEAL